MELGQKVIFNMRFLPISLCLACFGIIQQAFADEQQLLQLIEYISVDYAEAIQEGEVVNAFEYQEMLEFSSQVRLMVDELENSKAKATLKSTSEELREAVRDKRNIAEIRLSTNRLRDSLIDAYAVVVTPASAPDISRGREIYQTQCATCHGETGFGDGIAGEGLDPPATNFMDVDRYNERTLYGLFNTISLGVEGTAMSNFSQLFEADRWSLAFYVGSLASREVVIPQTMNIASVKTLVTITPAIAYERWEIVVRVKWPGCGTIRKSCMVQRRHHYCFLNKRLVMCWCCTSPVKLTKLTDNRCKHISKALSWLSLPCAPSTLR